MHSIWGRVEQLRVESTQHLWTGTCRSLDVIRTWDRFGNSVVWAFLSVSVSSVFRSMAFRRFLLLPQQHARGSSQTDREHIPHITAGPVPKFLFGTPYNGQFGRESRDPLCQVSRLWERDRPRSAVRKKLWQEQRSIHSFAQTAYVTASWRAQVSRLGEVNDVHSPVGTGRN